MLTETVLAIDASGEGCSVALWHNQSLIQRRSDTARQHAQSLLPMVDAILNEAGIPLNTVSTIALINGPGSFTGIRIALSVVQGLAYGLRVPVIGLSSLQVLAHAARMDLKETTFKLGDRVVEPKFICALDARMSEVYWSAFSVRGGQLYCTENAQVASFDSFSTALEKLSASQTESILALGSAFALEEIRLPANLELHAQLQPSASAMISLLLSFEEIETLKQDVVSLEPLYLRNEVAWKKRTRIRTESPF